MEPEKITELKKEHQPVGVGVCVPDSSIVPVVTWKTPIKSQGGYFSMLQFLE